LYYMLESKYWIDLTDFWIDKDRLQYTLLEYMACWNIPILKENYFWNYIKKDKFWISFEDFIKNKEINEEEILKNNKKFLITYMEYIQEIFNNLFETIMKVYKTTYESWIFKFILDENWRKIKYTKEELESLTEYQREKAELDQIAVMEYNYLYKTWRTHYLYD
jgi:hypothetical protein